MIGSDACSVMKSWLTYHEIVSKSQGSRGGCKEERHGTPRVHGKPNDEPRVQPLGFKNEAMQRTTTSCMAWLWKCDWGKGMTLVRHTGDIRKGQTLITPQTLTQKNCNQVAVSTLMGPHQLLHNNQESWCAYYVQQRGRDLASCSGSFCRWAVSGCEHLGGGSYSC